LVRVLEPVAAVVIGAPVLAEEMIVSGRFWPWRPSPPWLAL
jgi:hypothetical protein